MCITLKAKIKTLSDKVLTVYTKDNIKLGEKRDLYSGKDSTFHLKWLKYQF